LPRIEPRLARRRSLFLLRAMLACGALAFGAVRAQTETSDTAPPTTPPTTLPTSSAATAPAPTGTSATSPAATPAARIGAALRQGDRAGALKIADDYLATNPRDAQVRFLRAVVLADMNRLDESIAALESLTEDFPELPEPYNNLAVIRANQGQYATAEHYLQQAIAAQSNYITARENLGDLYISMAAAAYEQAGLLDPANATLKKKLALTRELGGKLRAR
jgi:tetratricopeptide (TPR) repeat protein